MSPTCTAPFQAQMDGTCGCPAGMMPDPANSASCIAMMTETTCMAGMMPDPANPMSCICMTGTMPDPANPASCIAMVTEAVCMDGMMPDPADPTVCIAEPVAGPSCAGADTTGDTFEAMQVMVTMRCGVCHRRSQAPSSGMLQLTGDMAGDRAEDFISLVVKDACEVEMPLVDQSGGDMALANSWLYWKVAGMTEGLGALAARPEWTSTMAACMQDPPDGFGVLMPLSVTEPIESVVSAVTNWICAGAPGPAAGAGMMDTMDTADAMDMADLMDMMAAGEGGGM